MNNNKKDDYQDDYEGTEMGLSFGIIIGIFLRNIWIALAAILLFGFMGLYYRENIRRAPIEYREHVSSIVFVTPTGPSGNQISLGQFFDINDLLIQVINRANRELDMDFTLTLVLLREGMNIQFHASNQVNVQLRSTPQRYLDMGFPTRTRIPSGPQNRYVNGILDILSEEAVEYAVRRHPDTNQLLFPHLVNLAESERHFVAPNSLGGLRIHYFSTISMFMFLIAGIAVGGAAAVGKELLSDRVYDFESIEKKHKTKIIGMIPDYKR